MKPGKDAQAFQRMASLLEVDSRRREPLRAARLLGLLAACAGRSLHLREASLATGDDLGIGLAAGLEQGWLNQAREGTISASGAFSEWASAFALTGGTDAVRGLQAGGALCDDPERRAMLAMAADPSKAGFEALRQPDPAAAVALGVGATVLHREDRLAEADRLTRRALEAYEVEGRLPGTCAPLLVARTQLALELGQAAEVQSLLELAHRMSGPPAPAFFTTALLILEGRHALATGAVAEARALLSRAELQARAMGAVDLVGLSRLSAGSLALQDGQVEAAQRLCRSALELCLGHPGHEASSLCALAVIAIRQGRPALARAAFDVALPRLELRFQRITAYPNAVLADTVLGDLEGAAARVDQMAERVSSTGPGRAAVCTARAFVEVASRRSHAALGTLAQVETELAGSPGAIRLVAAWTACRALLDQGDLVAAEARLAQATADPAYRQMADYRCALLLLEARLALAGGELDRARRVLGRARAMPEMLAAMDFGVQVALAALGLAQAEGDEVAAVQARHEALRAWEALTSQLEDAERQRFGAAFGRQATLQRLLVLTSQSTSPFPWLVGESPSFVAMLALLRRFAPTQATVLITGETGTGKELCARALHGLSGRKGGPFVALNCAAVSDELLLSELFGHERGAFTGAELTHRGFFETAGGGTLFLDEVGELSPRAQAALLRVLQDGSFSRVGGNTTLTADVRVLAATHRDLRDAVAKGEFRADLYYRLAGMEVPVPSLRERGADALLLARHFLIQAAQAKQGEPRQLAPEADALIGEYPWPGNIRQLQHAIRAADLLCDERRISAVLLASLLRRHPANLACRSGEEPDWLGLMRARNEGLKEFTAHIQRACVLRAVQESRGNLSEAASALGLSRSRISQLVNGDAAFRQLVDRLVE